MGTVSETHLQGQLYRRPNPREIGSPIAQDFNDLGVMFQPCQKRLQAGKVAERLTSSELPFDIKSSLSYILKGR
jgi:hypothetical protein